METKVMLDREGWDMECEAPLEVRHRETGGFATGYAAEIIIAFCEATQRERATGRQGEEVWRAKEFRLTEEHLLLLQHANDQARDAADIDAELEDAMQIVLGMAGRAATPGLYRRTDDEWERLGD